MSSKLIIAIDPSSGVTSPVGVAVMTSDLTVMDTVALMPKERYKVVEKRLVCLHEQLEAYLIPFVTVAIDSQMKIDIVLERFVMAGKTGQVLANAVGALITSIPNHKSIAYHTVHNIVLKKVIAGTGKGDKVAVAKGLLKHLPATEHDLVIKLLNGRCYDQLDAIALATCHIKGAE